MLAREKCVCGAEFEMHVDTIGDGDRWKDEDPKEAREAVLAQLRAWRADHARCREKYLAGRTSR